MLRVDLASCGFELYIYILFTAPDLQKPGHSPRPHDLSSQRTCTKTEQKQIDPSAHSEAMQSTTWPGLALTAREAELLKLAGIPCVVSDAYCWHIENSQSCIYTLRLHMADYIAQATAGTSNGERVVASVRRWRAPPPARGLAPRL